MTLEETFLNAISKCDHETFNACLTQGVDVNAIRPDGHSALTLATQRCSCHMVQALLATPGIDVNASGRHGPALVLATAFDDKLMISLLLEAKNIDLHGVNRHGNTALMLANDRNDEEIAHMLIAAGALH